MITDKEALQAARILYDYCENGICAKCCFRETGSGCAIVRPMFWRIPTDELPDAAKEHLMRRFTEIV